MDLTGGEPLLRNDWSKIAKHLIRKGIQVNVLTNGWRLNDEQAAELKDSGISCVGISLDGMKKTHDYVRGRSGSFTAVISALESLHRNDLPFNLITTVNALNIDELPDLLRLIMSMGVRFWRLQTVIPFGRARDFKEIKIGSDEIRTLGGFIRANSRSAAKEGLQIICSDGLMYIDESSANVKPWRGCSAGIVACGITSDGKVKGCLSMTDELSRGMYGKAISGTSGFNPAHLLWPGFDPWKLGPNCLSCEKANQCLGGCSANSFAATHEFHNDPYCHFGITTKPHS